LTSEYGRNAWPRDQEDRAINQEKSSKWVKQDALDEAVIELFRRAKEFRGDYDGWETKVIPQ
jgi:hypothetical protein